MIALAGVVAETNVVMLAYQDEAGKRRAEAGALKTLPYLLDAVAEGAMEGIRPSLMTALTNIISLFPVIWSSGGTMVGGVFSAMLLNLFVIPVLDTY